MDPTVKKVKRATVVIPTIHPSDYEVKLKRDNEQLIKRLDQLIQDPICLIRKA